MVMHKGIKFAGCFAQITWALLPWELTLRTHRDQYPDTDTNIKIHINTTYYELSVAMCYTACITCRYKTLCGTKTGLWCPYFSKIIHCQNLHICSLDWIRFLSPDPSRTPPPPFFFLRGKWVSVKESEKLKIGMEEWWRGTSSPKRGWLFSYLIFSRFINSTFRKYFTLCKIVTHLRKNDFFLSL